MIEGDALVSWEKVRNVRSLIHWYDRGIHLRAACRHAQAIDREDLAYRRVMFHSPDDHVVMAMCPLCRGAFLASFVSDRMG